MTAECILWRGPVFAGGYGRVLHNTYAHRAVYEAHFGSIPRGQAVHHTCEVKLCVNPDHLQLVTPAEHIGIHQPSRRAPTHCKRGHEFTEANTYRYRGKRQCRACQSDRERRYRERQRGMVA